MAEGLYLPAGSSGGPGKVPLRVLIPRSGAPAPGFGNCAGRNWLTRNSHRMAMEEDGWEKAASWLPRYFTSDFRTMGSFYSLIHIATDNFLSSSCLSRLHSFLDLADGTLLHTTSWQVIRFLRNLQRGNLDFDNVVQQYELS